MVNVPEGVVSKGTAKRGIFLLRVRRKVQRILNRSCTQLEKNEIYNGIVPATALVTVKKYPSDYSLFPSSYK